MCLNAKSRCASLSLSFVNIFAPLWIGHQFHQLFLLSHRTGAPTRPSASVRLSPSSVHDELSPAVDGTAVCLHAAVPDVRPLGTVSCLLGCTGSATSDGRPAALKLSAMLARFGGDPVRSIVRCAKLPWPVDLRFGGYAENSSSQSITSVCCRRARVPFGDGESGLLKLFGDDVAMLLDRPLAAVPLSIVCVPSLSPGYRLFPAFSLFLPPFAHLTAPAPAAVAAAAPATTAAPAACEARPPTSTAIPHIWASAIL